jgi:hypothetical protein
MNVYSDMITITMFHGSTPQPARFVVLDTGNKKISSVHEEWQLEAGVVQPIHGEL